VSAETVIRDIIFRITHPGAGSNVRRFPIERVTPAPLAPVIDLSKERVLRRPEQK
jgi:hypothetical protein